MSDDQSHHQQTTTIKTKVCFQMVQSRKEKGKRYSANFIMIYWKLTVLNGINVTNILEKLVQIKAVVVRRWLISHQIRTGTRAD